MYRSIALPTLLSTALIAPAFAEETEKNPTAGEQILQSFESVVDMEKIYQVTDDGDSADPKIRQTVRDTNGFYYTIDDFDNWVKYELDPDRGVIIHTIRNSEYNSTIDFPTPWLMYPVDIQSTRSYEAKVDFTVYHIEKDTRDGTMEWSLEYKGLRNKSTENNSFTRIPYLTSRVEIDFPYKFGLTFDEDHYFSPENGEVFRRIDGDATFLGFSIRSRELIESFSSKRELDESERMKVKNRIENNIKKITITVDLEESDQFSATTPAVTIPE